jgi:hypothetical protein
MGARVLTPIKPLPHVKIHTFLEKNRKETRRGESGSSVDVRNCSKVNFISYCKREHIRCKLCKPDTFNDVGDLF